MATMAMAVHFFSVNLIIDLIIISDTSIVYTDMACSNSSLLPEFQDNPNQPDWFDYLLQNKSC